MCKWLPVRNWALRQSCIECHPRMHSDLCLHSNWHWTGIRNLPFVRSGRCCWQSGWKGATLSLSALYWQSIVHRWPITWSCQTVTPDAWTRFFCHLNPPGWIETLAWQDRRLGRVHRWESRDGCNGFLQAWCQCPDQQRVGRHLSRVSGLLQQPERHFTHLQNI